MTPGTRRWLALTATLGALALGAALFPPEALDWQPALALREPWRAFTAAGVHYSAQHLTANLAGAMLVGALGVAAAVPASMAWAWAIAWPLTQLGLLARPDLLHFGGLSGVLHAGVAVAGTHLVGHRPGRPRLIGVALLAGLAVKVWSEAPGGPALRHPAGWDIATAPFAHASGLAAGLACALIALAFERSAGRAGSP